SAAVRLLRLILRVSISFSLSLSLSRSWSHQFRPPISPPPSLQKEIAINLVRLLATVTPSKPFPPGGCRRKTGEKRRTRGEGGRRTPAGPSRGGAPRSAPPASVCPAPPTRRPKGLRRRPRAGSVFVLVVVFVALEDEPVVRLVGVGGAGARLLLTLHLDRHAL